MEISCQMNKHKMSNLKPIISVIEMAKSVGLSRARFYQLLEQGIFPQPLYCIRTKRPFFNIELQQACHDVKNTGIGFNNQFILFYSPRKNNSNNISPKRKTRTNNKYDELSETLTQMGLNNINSLKIEGAINEIYPDEIPNDEGVILRELFRYFKDNL